MKLNLLPLVNISGGYGGPGGPPAGIDPSVYQWFLSVDQDKSGHITAHELQQALVNGNWSHFNPETCRLMISKFFSLFHSCKIIEKKKRFLPVFHV